MTPLLVPHPCLYCEGPIPADRTAKRLPKYCSAACGQKHRASQVKPCTDCGREFRSASLRCRPCRMTDRTCEGCGKRFHSDRPKCGECAKKIRSCTSCGATFKGGAVKCFTCTYLNPETRTCSCGADFKSTNGSRKCWRCRQVFTEKPCTGCGTPFTGTAKRCNPCRATMRTCSCGKMFKSRAHTACSVCRKTEKPCDECGRMIRKLGRTCGTCLNKRDRTCADCGTTYKGMKRLCNKCEWLAKPYEDRSTRAIAASNKRRATRKAAEVTGPVPAEVYATLRAEPECVYCGKPPTQIDHVRPLHQGGWEHESNLVPACGPCNHSKGPRLLTEWDQDKALRGAASSDKVAAEYRRLLGNPLDELLEGVPA